MDPYDRQTVRMVDEALGVSRQVMVMAHFSGSCAAVRTRGSGAVVQHGIASDRVVGKNGFVESARHLLIDGYNILHAWRWLSRAGRSPDLQTPRDRLLEAVQVLHDVEGLRITIVFDGRSARSEPVAHPGEAAVAVIFAPEGKTADDVIERLVAAAAVPANITVATGDGPESDTVTAAGAACISPAALQDWCERCRARVHQTAARRAAKRGDTWGNRLPL